MARLKPKLGDQLPLATMHRAQVLARQILAAACAAPPDVVKAFCLGVTPAICSCSSLMQHQFEGDGTNRKTPCCSEHAARSVSVCCQQQSPSGIVAGGSCTVAVLITSLVWFETMDTENESSSVEAKRAFGKWQVRQRRARGASASLVSTVWSRLLRSDILS